MSGGSYNYICHAMEDIDIQIDNSPKRRVFAKLFKLVAKAMHDIEWVDSCDYSDGDEDEAIDAVFNFLKGDPETKAKALAYDEIVALVTKKEIK